ncbi:30S ribosomal protein S24e [Sulfodiicoccus acidiphilus]|uniref:Small ribosomal subunit protein eS24 n=1 Tax=Sulfodiicoccus acidiphilus TaxID=1670455 RepID=A0A348B767_9CREN|nr:30S ribosomal protein S24e [Sulfodiicoccus acidiphilus]BBD74019.1 30S ribosomal protein S24e [Sulfodiicoccus acidiphilus]GGT87123.1 30S ribosomal protein S24e [Sulfodiicoccus acidiphilus]
MSEVKVRISDKVEGVVELEMDNKVIGRKELVVTLFHIGASTPSRKEIIDGLSKVLNAKTDRIVVRRIDTSYGAGVSKVRVNMYEDGQKLKLYEYKHVLDRDAGTKQKKGGKSG